jgi:fluoroacetyl-CoA thioesterase
MEHACILALEPHLDAGEASVGIGIDLKHFAPTPAIVARDEVDEIGRAKHERMVVESIRFAGSLAAKEKLLAQART